MSVNSKMTAICDEVRTLSGETDKLGLDELATRTHEANTEVDTQEELIQRIKISLQGKVAGGGVEDLDTELTEQETLIAELKEVLRGKASGSRDMEAFLTRTIVEVSSDIEEIGLYAFTYCTKLEKIDFPNAKKVNSYCFQYCSALSSTNLPKVQSIGGYGFMGCTALAEIDMPNILSVSNYAFRKCDALTKIDLYQTYSIGTFAFYECPNLDTVILRKTDKVCTLAAANAFQYTKIADGAGHIYVPSALLDSYRSATNWSTYSSLFKAIEGSEYE